MNLDVGCLAFSAAERLMDHDSRMRKRVAPPLLPGCEQERAHTRRLTKTKGRNRRLDEQHRVVDREARRYRATRRVDVEVDLFLWIFGFQEQELRGDQIGDVVINFAAKKNDSIP